MPNLKISISPASLIDAIQDRALDLHYWRTFAVLGGVSAIDYFDFFIVGFLVADFAHEWKLTYLHTAVIFLAGGIGSIVGALAGGALADRVGRKPVLLLGALVGSIAGALMAVVPDGSWQLFAALRFVVGIVVGSLGAAVVALIVELTPRKNRSVMTGLNIVAPSAGILLSSLIAGGLLPTLGWRFVAGLGAAPLIFLVPIYFFVPESVPWLLSRGRNEDARREASKILGYATNDLAVSPQPARAERPRERLYVNPRYFWLVFLMATGSSAGIFGTYLWGPSILTAVGRLKPSTAASLFAFVSVAAIGGKVLFSFLPQWTGRRICGVVTLGIGTISLASAALTGSEELAGIPMILFSFVGVGLALDGGGANLIPYSAEIFPVRLASRGVGLAQAGSGLGRIFGPISLALIAGSNDIMRPAATSVSITPAFLFLAALSGLGLLAILLVPVETGGRRLDVQ